MATDSIHSPPTGMKTTYYPPRFPPQPPHDYIHPRCLTTVESSTVRITTEQGLPDIPGYLIMGQAIDISEARNPIEIRIFQRISSVEELTKTVQLPQLASHRIRRSFYLRATELQTKFQEQQRRRQQQEKGGGHTAAADDKTNITQLGFWHLFHFMYISHMMLFRNMLRIGYPDLLRGINWDFVFREPCTDVNIMLYLWMVGVWHAKMDGEAALTAIADQIRILLPLI